MEKSSPSIYRDFHGLGHLSIYRQTDTHRTWKYRFIIFQVIVLPITWFHEFLIWHLLWLVYKFLKNLMLGNSWNWVVSRSNNLNFILRKDFVIVNVLEILSLLEKVLGQFHQQWPSSEIIKQKVKKFWNVQLFQINSCFKRTQDLRAGELKTPLKLSTK